MTLFLGKFMISLSFYGVFRAFSPVFCTISEKLAITKQEKPVPRSAFPVDFFSLIALRKFSHGVENLFSS